MRFMAPRHLFLMLIICVVWGFTFVAGKAGVSEMPPMLFTALRYALLSVLLVPFLRIVEGKMPQVLAISITMGSIHFALFYGGLSARQNVSAIAVAVQLSVPISTVMSIVFSMSWLAGDDGPALSCHLAAWWSSVLTPPSLMNVWAF